MTFVVDGTAGRLARWLRLLGFDVYYRASIPDGELIARALAEGRVILTRSSSLPETRALPAHLVLARTDLPSQLRQVFHAFRLRADPARVFTRCSACNQPLEALEREAARGKVPPFVYERQESFFSCPSCGKIFWKGTHWDRVMGKVKEMELDRVDG